MIGKLFINLVTRNYIRINNNPSNDKIINTIKYVNKTAIPRLIPSLINFNITGSSEKLKSNHNSG